MKYVRIDYTIYYPKYVSTRDSQGAAQEGHGECWDYPTMRGAKKKARELGVGSLIVRNFNTPETPNKAFAWWQSDHGWVWDGAQYRKAFPVIESKWIIAEEHWQSAKRREERGVTRRR